MRGGLSLKLEQKPFNNENDDYISTGRSGNSFGFTPAWG